MASELLQGMAAYIISSTELAWTPVCKVISLLSSGVVFMKPLGRDTSKSSHAIRWGRGEMDAEAERVQREVDEGWGFFRCIGGVKWPAK